jgi:hypothetical protein
MIERLDNMAREEHRSGCDRHRSKKGEADGAVDPRNNRSYRSRPRYMVHHPVLAYPFRFPPLAINRKWAGKGKWMARALDALDPALTRQALSAIQAVHMTGDRAPLASFARQVLEAAGGALWEGFYAAGRRS